MPDLSPFPIQLALFILLFASLEIALIIKDKHKLAVILACSFTLVFPLMLPKPIDTDSTVRLTIAEQEELVKEHEIFSEWYTDYNKTIDRLDSLWQKYHRITRLVQDDEIQIINASIRMDQINEDSQAINEEIEKLKVPEQLSPEIRMQIQQIITKTQEYSKLQHLIVEKSAHALDSQTSKNKNRELIVRELQSILILNNQPNLDVLPHIANIKDYFSSKKI